MSVRLARWKKTTSFSYGPPAEEDLIDLAAPFRRRLVAQHGDVDEVGTLPLDAGPDPEARVRIRLRDAAGIEVVNAVRRDDEAHAPDRVELARGARASSATGECSRRLPSARRITVIRVPTWRP